MHLLNILKRKLLAITALAMLLAPAGLIPAPAFANIDASKSAACEGIGLASNSGGCSGNADSKVVGIIGVVVNLLSLVVGVAAVIMIIVSGFRFITGGGDSSKVAAARSGLVYAIIGLIIVALAQFIVRFVITNATG